MSARFPLAAGIVGVVAFALGIILGVSQPDTVFHSYLMAYTLWLGLGIGCLAIAMIQFLTGGNWGLATRRILEAGAATVPLMAVLFLPILLGLPRLYAWARPEDVAADAVLQHRALYLNPPFFTIRSLIYVVAWILLAYYLRRLSTAQDNATSGPGLRALVGLQRFSVIGIIILGLTVSFAAIDWLMSLDTRWFSTMFPPLVGIGFLLFALAFSIVVLTRLQNTTEVGQIVTPRLYNELGSLLLAFTMLWGYMTYFQYMLIWAGNLTDEIPWYLARVDGGWLPVALTVAAVGFGVPFWFLLFRPLKRNPRTLAAIALVLIVMRFVDVFWLVQPPFEPAGPVVNVLDVLFLIAFGGIWLALFTWQLPRRPLLAPNDPRLPQALEAAREAI